VAPNYGDNPIIKARSDAAQSGTELDTWIARFPSTIAVNLLPVSSQRTTYNSIYRTSGQAFKSVVDPRKTAFARQWRGHSNQACRSDDEATDLYFSSGWHLSATRQADFAHAHQAMELNIRCKICTYMFLQGSFRFYQTREANEQTPMEFVEANRFYASIMRYDDHHHQCEFYQPLPYDLGRAIARLASAGYARDTLVSNAKGKYFCSLLGDLESLRPP